MNPLRSVRNKLAFLFFVITALSFSVVVFYVVPQLQSSLEDKEVEDLVANTNSSVRLLRAQADETLRGPEADRVVRRAAESADAVVTLLAPSPAGATSEPFYVVSDSRERRNIPPESEPAEEAVQKKRLVSTVLTIDGRREARTAVPIYAGDRLRWVALYSRDLEDITETVSVIRNQVLVSSAVALLLALVGGYIVASRLARRVRRVENAAQQVAGGHFVDPLPVDSKDELGQLTQLVQRDAGEAPAARPRAPRVHRERVARAAHADLLARRLRGAAPGRGARDRHARGVPRDDE